MMGPNSAAPRRMIILCLRASFRSSGFDYCDLACPKRCCIPKQHGILNTNDPRRRARNGGNSESREESNFDYRDDVILLSTSRRTSFFLKKRVLRATFSSRLRNLEILSGSGKLDPQSGSSGLDRSEENSREFTCTQFSPSRNRWRSKWQHSGFDVRIDRSHSREIAVQLSARRSKARACAHISRRIISDLTLWKITSETVRRRRMSSKFKRIRRLGSVSAIVVRNNAAYHPVVTHMLAYTILFSDAPRERI